MLTGGKEWTELMNSYGRVRTSIRGPKLASGVLVKRHCWAPYVTVRRVMHAPSENSYVLDISGRDFAHLCVLGVIAKVG